MRFLKHLNDHIVNNDPSYRPDKFKKYLKRPKFGHTIIKVPNSGHWILGGDEAGESFATNRFLVNNLNI